MNKEQLEEYLIHQVVPDIIQCMNENSRQNRHGRYGVEVDDRVLHVDFAWSDRLEVFDPLLWK